MPRERVCENSAKRKHKSMSKPFARRTKFDQSSQRHGCRGYQYGTQQIQVTHPDVWIGSQSPNTCGTPNQILNIPNCKAPVGHSVMRSVGLVPQHNTPMGQYPLPEGGGENARTSVFKGFTKNQDMQGLCPARAPLGSQSTPRNP